MNRWKLIITLFLLVALAGCGGTANSVGGTETGNGEEDLGGTVAAERPSQPAVGGSVAAKTIGRMLCDKLSQCFPGTDEAYAACLTHVNQADHLSTALGLSAAEYPNLAAVFNAESDGELVNNHLALSDCADRIINLSCDDPALSAAYSAASPDDLSHLYLLLDQNDLADSQRACANVFDLTIGGYMPPQDL